MHSIQKQSVQLNISDFGAASAWQSRLESLCLGPLAKELEAVFDSQGVGDQLIEIERLDIDLSIHSLTISDRQLIEKIKQEIELNLKTSVEKTRLGSIAQVTEYRDQEIALKAKKSTRAMAVDYPDLPALAKAFLIFLESGLLPWWYEQPSPATFRSKIIEEVFEQSITPRSTFIPLLIRLLQKQAIRQRLFSSFSSSFYRAFFTYLLPDQQQLVIAIIDLLEEGKAIQETLTNRVHRLSALIQWISPQLLQKETSDSLAFTLFTFLLKATSFSPKVLIQKLKEKQVNKKQLIKIEQQLIEQSTIHQSQTPSLAPTEVSKTTPASSSNETRWTYGGSHFYEEIYIQNAGLVLLAPFISPFLKNCGLVKEGELTDPEKATHLLEFLVRGETDQMEYQLPLNKILCGIPLEESPEESQEENIELLPEEQQEAEDLLRSVVKHWSILEGTSNDGFRGTFLLRDGKLIQEGDQWRLIVEPGTFDMLLEHLPWTLSIIQTPWMENPIWVEWN